MKEALGLLLSIIFFILSLIHVYWAIGGKKGLRQAVPFTSDDANEPLFKPGKIATMFVAIVLAFFCFIVLLKINFINLNRRVLQNNYLYHILNVIAFLFLARSIGDFKYVGIAKKINDTEFAKYDSRLYVPLCLFIFTLILIINLE